MQVKQDTVVMQELRLDNNARRGKEEVRGGAKCSAFKLKEEIVCKYWRENIWIKRLFKRPIYFYSDFHIANNSPSLHTLLKNCII